MAPKGAATAGGASASAPPSAAKRKRGAPSGEQAPGHNGIAFATQQQQQRGQAPDELAAPAAAPLLQPRPAPEIP